MKIFLQPLYENISTFTPIQVKPEIPKSLVPLHSSLQPFMKCFYKIVTYYMINYDYNINTWNIRRQIIGYIMSLKRKQRMKLDANNHEEDKYYLMFKNTVSSDSDLLQSNTHKECCVLNANAYNYKLRSVIGQEDEPKVTK